MVPVSLRPQLRPLLTGDDAVVAVAPDAAEFGARRSSTFVGDWNSLREILKLFSDDSLVYVVIPIVCTIRRAVPLGEQLHASTRAARPPCCLRLRRSRRLPVQKRRLRRRRRPLPGSSVGSRPVPQACPPPRPMSGSIAAEMSQLLAVLTVRGKWRASAVRFWKI